MIHVAVHQAFLWSVYYEKLTTFLALLTKKKKSWLDAFKYLTKYFSRYCNFGVAIYGYYIPSILSSLYNLTKLIITKGQSAHVHMPYWIRNTFLFWCQKCFWNCLNIKNVIPNYFDYENHWFWKQFDCKFVYIPISEFLI